jgi:hypothetical protein
MPKKDNKTKAAEKKARVAAKASKKAAQKEKKAKSKGGDDSDADDVDLEAQLEEYARQVGFHISPPALTGPLSSAPNASTIALRVMLLVFLALTMILSKHNISRSRKSSASRLLLDHQRRFSDRLPTTTSFYSLVASTTTGHSLPFTMICSST